MNQNAMKQRSVEAFTGSDVDVNLLKLLDIRCEEYDGKIIFYSDDDSDIVPRMTPDQVEHVVDRYGKPSSYEWSGNDVIAVNYNTETKPWIINDTKTILSCG